MTDALKVSVLDPAVLPVDFVADIRRWQTRSGTVKINLALDRLPVFTSHPSLTRRSTAARSSWPRAWTTSRPPSSKRSQASLGRPFADICIPSVFDDSLAPAGKHVMSMFTQWVPTAGPRSRTRRTGSLRRPGHGPDGAGRARVHRARCCTGR